MFLSIALFVLLICTTLIGFLAKKQAIKSIFKSASLFLLQIFIAGITLLSVLPLGIDEGSENEGTLFPIGLILVIAIVLIILRIVYRNKPGRVGTITFFIFSLVPPTLLLFVVAKF